jgi:hypothetical protein
MRPPARFRMVQSPAAALSLVVALLGSAAAPAAAQAQGQAQSGGAATRAALLAAERDRKAAETAPPKRSAVEKGLYWYDNQYVLAKIFGGWKGIHLAGGDFPAGAGIKFGVGYTYTSERPSDLGRPNNLDVDAVAAYSTNGYLRTRASLGVRNIAGSAVDARGYAQYYEFPQEDFFGLHQDSLRENRTSYLQEATEFGGELRWNPAKVIELGAGFAFINPSIGPGTDTRFPSTEQLFNPATIPGLLVQPDFVRRDLSAAIDWRDNRSHPHAGGRYGVEFSRFHDRDLDAFGFDRVTIDLQQYVPLPHKYRTLALRATAVLTDPLAGQDVPFFFQPTLGGSQALRGFREFRFRDRNSLVMTAEYRWQASWMLDGALFVDAGQVAFNRRDFNLRELDVSYGVGFRVHSNDAFVARLDLAVSREGFIPLLRFEHVF